MEITAIVNLEVAALAPVVKHWRSRANSTESLQPPDVKQRDWRSTPQSFSNLQHTVILGGKPATHCHSCLQVPMTPAFAFCITGLQGFTEGETVSVAQ